MIKRLDMDSIEAAQRMAAMSPETQRRFDESMSLGWSEAEQVSVAFHAIGAAIGSRQQPVSSSNMKKIFAFAEQLLSQGSEDVMNAVATCMLEEVWAAAQSGGFDLADVDPHLGPLARGYLAAWDDFNRKQPKGLRRR